MLPPDDFHPDIHDQYKAMLDEGEPVDLNGTLVVL